MKNTFTSALLISALLLSSSSLYSQTANLRIGHVDIAQILSLMPARDSAAAQLEKESKEIQSTYDSMTIEYNKLLDTYEKDQAKLSETVRKNKEAELMDKEKRLKDFGQNAAETLQKRNSELIQPLLNNIIVAINKVATDNGFTYILDVSKGSVVFTSKESENINQLVMKELKITK